MRILVSGEENVGILEQLVANHVAECVIFFVDREDGRVGNFGVLLFCDLFLAVKEKE